MNPIQRLSVTLAEAAATEESARQTEIVDRDDWLSRVGDVARRLRAATRTRAVARAVRSPDED
jgi:hypothetical protein